MLTVNCDSISSDYFQQPVILMPLQVHWIASFLDVEKSAKIPNYFWWLPAKFHRKTKSTTIYEIQASETKPLTVWMVSWHSSTSRRLSVGVLKSFLCTYSLRLSHAPSDRRNYSENLPFTSFNSFLLYFSAKTSMALCKLLSYSWDSLTISMLRYASLWNTSWISLILLFCSLLYITLR